MSWALFVETWVGWSEPQDWGSKSQVLHLGLRAACAQVCSQDVQDGAFEELGFRALV